MGIPKYFKLLVEKYPHIIEPVTLDSPKQIDALFLDMNGLIHPMCQQALQKLRREVKESSTPISLSQEQIEKILVQAVIDGCIHLCQMIQPTTTIFLSIDGPAPQAKMNQQQQRRFRTVEFNQLRKQIKINHGKNPSELIEWNSNAITPGTAFLDKVSDALKNMITHHQWFTNYRITHPTCHYYLSSGRVPGEGEHKIFEWIRSHEVEIATQTFCIYGLDADLIMLSLSLGFGTCYLLREAVHFGQIVLDEYLYLSITDLGISLEESIRSLKPRSRSRSRSHNTISSWNLSTLTRQQLIDDYILLCFLLGNDFMPHHQALTIHHSTVTWILSIYCEQVHKTGKSLFNRSDHEVNVSMLQSIITKIASSETFKIRQSLQYYYNSRIRYPDTCDTKLKKELYKLTIMPLRHRDQSSDILIQHCQSKYWRQGYYRQLFPELPTENWKQYEKDIQTMCETYWKQFLWCIEYYFTNKPICWKQHYSWHHAPSLYDLSRYCQCTIFRNYLKHTTEFRKNPIKPLTQLLYVLPPASVTLLPSAYHFYMIDSKSPMYSMYPRKLQLDMYHCRWFHECGVMVPKQYSIQEIEQFLEMNRVSDKLTASETLRNQFEELFCW